MNFVYYQVSFTLLTRLILLFLDACTVMLNGKCKIFVFCKPLIIHLTIGFYIFALIFFGNTCAEVLHRKLLLQIEETMKDQLNVAETSITAIRKYNYQNFLSSEHFTTLNALLILKYQSSPKVSCTGVSKGFSHLALLFA
ncbi:hypothetical protein MA16_Dca024795 [Dendrobium catenatum]|uniref:Uncharacterized protein n=1 Tax=Dendrobium catenatum TaxID=906689 RepID=A0A2I0VIF9_9ASPA|nr:hypothetical protein MA16_Dca024795 [Dendrobium catenatum]